MAARMIQLFRAYFTSSKLYCDSLPVLHTTIIDQLVLDDYSAIYSVPNVKILTFLSKMADCC